MKQEHERAKIAVQCSTCSEIYAAWTRIDGDLRLIGTDECQCGATEFDRLS